MSLSLSRVSLARVAASLVCGPSLVALGACHHRSSALEEPSPAEQMTVGQDRQPNDKGRPRSFPGVDISRTRSGAVSIRILGSVVGDGAPLYVIDGTPAVVDPSLGINWLEPEDIAQIRVLKDPAQTAVYGPRGVNGVIVITTKQAATLRKRAR
jgi:TonB-dependent SusC/RagA subfamily outer membrane receptor